MRHLSSHPDSPRRAHGRLPIGQFHKLLIWIGLFVPAAALALDLPLVHPEREAVFGPAYLADRLEIRLNPIAAADARLIRNLQPEGTRLEHLGVASVDRLAASLGGVWFEPEFRGEVAPSPGADETDFTAFYIAHLPAAVSLEMVRDRFRALREVMSADPIAVLPVSRVPNDSLWTSSWWYYNVAGRHDIDAPAAWDVNIGDTAVVIGILDTGVIPYHPDLGGRVAGLSGQIWTNWDEAGGTPNVDDDLNGFIDDVHGWDFVELPSGAGVPTDEDWDQQDNDPNDYAGHGTLVAGIAGALSDNGIGVTGTAWNVRLMPLRIGWSTEQDPLGLVDMSFVAQALRYATLMKVDVVNCSFSTLNLSGLFEAAEAATRAGVTIVAAAGNNGQFHDLAERQDVIAVAASRIDDRISGESNRGDYVDLAAPGEDIASTFIAVPRTAARQPAYAAGLTGTSLSAPMVSGAVALMQSEWRRLGLPRLTPTDVLLRLRETTDNIAAANVGLSGYGTGRLNLFRALTDPPTSNAIRLGARTVGAGVLLPRRLGPETVVFATNNQRLLMTVGNTDTLRVTSLPAPPIAGIAAGNLTYGGKIAMFIPMTAGRIAGVDELGTMLPGWPVTTGGHELRGAPALGDLDGDDALEVICGADDGNVWAWRADGSVMPGFPHATGASGISGSVALSDLDGGAGVEIVACTDAGTLHVIGGNGMALPSWPKTLMPPMRSPVVARRGLTGPPMIVTTAGPRLVSFDVQGNELFNTALTTPGAALGGADPALGDIDGDGADEIIVATNGTFTVAVFDSSGTMLSSRGWPRSLPAIPQGPPVVGQLRADPSGRPEILVMLSTGLIALTDSARVLSTFPKPGGAGSAPTLTVDLQHGDTRVVAGTGPDSMLYFYSAGPGSAFGTRYWTTPRGNFARTGSRLYNPPLTLEFSSAPSAVNDLHAVAATETTVTLQWTATADDGPTGRPESYWIAAAQQPIDESSFGSWIVTASPATKPPGGLESARVEGLARGRRYWFAIKAHDADGNLSAISNVITVQTPLGGPLGNNTNVALASRTQPSRLPVELYWQGTGSAPTGTQSIRIYDLSGRLVRTLPLGNEAAAVATWDGRDDHASVVPAGFYFARLTSGSVHAQARVVLLP